MDVDVIIPVYNGARFVRRAIRSALDQSFTGSVTVWCIDDASTDESMAVLTTTAATDERITVLSNERNQGVAATRNRGVREASGEFIAFLDQDDEWWPDKLERQVAALTADPTLGYVVGLQQISLEEGEPQPGWTRTEWFERPQLAYLPSALLVRRTSFLEIGYFEESLALGGDDTDWFARARRRAVPHRLLHAPLVKRHIHRGNASSNSGSDHHLLAAVRRHITDGRSTP